MVSFEYSKPSYAGSIYFETDLSYDNIRKEIIDKGNNAEIFEYNGLINIKITIDDN